MPRKPESWDWSLDLIAHSYNGRDIEGSVACGNAGSRFLDHFGFAKHDEGNSPPNVTDIERFIVCIKEEDVGLSHEKSLGFGFGEAPELIKRTIRQTQGRADCLKHC